MNIPTRTVLLVMVLMSLVLAACGGAGGGGGGGDAESTLPDRATASSEDEEGTTYQLQEGRYRLSYRAPDCEDVVVSIVSADGAFSYEQRQRVATSFVRGLVDGEYTIGVTSDCDEWEVTLIKF